MNESTGSSVVSAPGPAAAAVAGGRHRGKDRAFYTVMVAAIAVTVFAGFAPTFYLRGLFQTKPLPALLVVHGILFTMWVALLVTQVRLVAARRTDIHRRLGVAGAFLAAAMPVVGVIAAITSAKRGFTPPNGPPPLVFLAIPLTDMVIFATLVGLGLWFRRRTEIHRRLMLLSTIAILTPAIARISLIRPLGMPAFLGTTDLFIVTCIAYDRIRNGKFHPAFLWGGLAVIVSQPARILFAMTPAWQAFATWLTR